LGAIFFFITFFTAFFFVAIAESPMFKEFL